MLIVNITKKSQTTWERGLCTCPWGILLITLIIEGSLAHGVWHHPTWDPGSCKWRKGTEREHRVFALCFWTVAASSSCSVNLPIMMSSVFELWVRIDHWWCLMLLLWGYCITETEKKRQKMKTKPKQTNKKIKDIPFTRVVFPEERFLSLLYLSKDRELSKIWTCKPSIC